MSHRSLPPTRRRVLALSAALLILPGYRASAEASQILVHKDPDCGCCTGWVRHLQGAGFTVTVRETRELHLIRRRLGVPADLASCHTAEASGYAIEGHVPAVAVRRLLVERPAAVGLAVPGMPIGSPGMEGGAPERYDVILFGNGGRGTFMTCVGAETAG